MGRVGPGEAGIEGRAGKEGATGTTEGTHGLTGVREQELRRPHRLLGSRLSMESHDGPLVHLSSFLTLLVIVGTVLHPRLARERPVVAGADAVCKVDDGHQVMTCEVEDGVAAGRLVSSAVRKEVHVTDRTTDTHSALQMRSCPSLATEPG